MASRCLRRSVTPALSTPSSARRLARARDLPRPGCRSEPTSSDSAVGDRGGGRLAAVGRGADRGHLRAARRRNAPGHQPRRLVQSRFHGKRVAAVGFACTYGILPTALSRRPQLARRQCRPTEAIPPLCQSDGVVRYRLLRVQRRQAPRFGTRPLGRFASRRHHTGSCAHLRRPAMTAGLDVAAMHSALPAAVLPLGGAVAASTCSIAI